MNSTTPDTVLIGGEQKHQSVKTDGICTILCSAMGTGGGYVPMVIGNVNPSGRGINGNVYGGDLSPTLTTNKGEGLKILVGENERECESSHNR